MREREVAFSGKGVAFCYSNVKMSPSRPDESVTPLLVRMMKLAVSVVDLDASSKGFAELHLGTGEAETFWLGRDLETAAVPMHDVFIADDALVDGAADAAEIFWGRAPSLFPFSGSAAEAAGLDWRGKGPRRPCACRDRPGH